ncbi:hypothetical protein [Mahella australiensis]|uniref:ABC-2 family transporter protein n=1 Tax=Mahella australiensis (strain DSM 15567 / CIP 107919 / 50-1 BON) TaxID=697281 RepID=F3ZXW3_MAHA5|nr:hypothetical protein [Mahella australiensis]AEE96633.1 hypothetical protein Mahau_1441 [Mahella australiensis 50-1 BON]
MKLFISLMKADLYRAILSFNFIISVAFIIFVMFISCSGFITDTADVMYLLGHALTGSGSTLFVLCIAPILPYGMSFASDTEDKATFFWVIRTGVKKYAISKFISSIIAGFLSVCIGIVIFSLLMSVFFPLFNQISSGDSYIALLENNKPIMYILVIAVHYSLSAALFAGGAIAVSAFISNKFSVIAAPIVIYFVLMRLVTHASIPVFFKPDFLVQSIYPNVSPLEAFLYKLMPVIVLLGILLFVTVKQIKRRIETS